MNLTAWGAAVFAALLFPPMAAAQDITLTSRDGSLSLSGMLQGYAGEFFRISTNSGPQTVDGQGVVREGPACPALTAPKAVIRCVGAADAGATLLPPLFAAFARVRGLTYSPSAAGSAVISDPASGDVLAELSFTAATPADDQCDHGGGVGDDFAGSEAAGSRDGWGGSAVFDLSVRGRNDDAGCRLAGQSE